MDARELRSGARESNGRRRLRLAGWVSVGALIITSAWWAPRVLSHLSFFRMQRVEVHGLQYLSEAELLKQLAVDTTYSIWTDLGPLQKRLTLHPQLLSVTLSRKLPGTLVIRVEERQPLALVPGPRGFVAVDDSGAAVPVDPSRGTIDVPILQAADTTVLRLLAAVRDSEPALFGRISEIERVGTNELDIHLREVRVLAMSDITLTRLLDILPVERDLASKGMRVAELDLRYSGQVIARQVRKR